MRHFSHQTNKRFYLHSFTLTLTRHARGKVDSILLPHMQKLREALADARKSIRKRIENKQ